MGRPHLARAVLDAPTNRARLAAEGADSFAGMFERYLGEGRAAYVARESPSVGEAIVAIHAAGGVAVWAHPFFDVAAPDLVTAEIERYRAEGLDGVECFYPTHERSHVELLCDLCERHGLLRTGSADFHGPEHPAGARFRDFELYGREPDLGPIAATS